MEKSNYRRRVVQGGKITNEGEQTIAFLRAFGAEQFLRLINRQDQRRRRLAADFFSGIRQEQTLAYTDSA